MMSMNFHQDKSLTLQLTLSLLRYLNHNLPPSASTSQTLQRIGYALQTYELLIRKDSPSELPFINQFE